MKKLLLFFVLQIIGCGNSTEIKVENKRDYSNFHSEAFRFCETNDYETSYYFLVDLSQHSGTNRFFVYDFKQKKIILKNLVTHGSCDVFEVNQNSEEVAKFSNKNDSHCSSLGKYKIGKRDYSSWGINVKYWLHGLENSNANAVKRVVVLHSWDAVANQEIFPKYSPNSWGCPAVSNPFMRVLDVKLQAAEKPVLLWIIE
ncbi:peptidase [Flavobacterium sp. NST-5]|uniref:Peptidase n=1 Tax=Flavobacterium ichthyis TaxID=2698827 RepID=A0ABW9Z9U1_9FLAO|nr:murein L,D-transpeptidase catalytic domain family protein [Flavobacterium ichthyis]NBL64880.1 peptidase [Flavobacterium ichthyis]